MREETADTVLQLLTDAVDDGIAQPASIPGYSVAGKTGTAQIAGPITTRVRTGTDAHGKPTYEKTTRFGYIDGWIDSSFISLLPASDPKIVTLLLIHRPGDLGPVPDGAAARRPVPRPGARHPELPGHPAGPPDQPVASR